ncbi:hypothetical protein MMC07_002694 [Pseudocyphellaria aurata]|nr:hypothetical protein [Pseudocyphellaria aurata]
MNYLRPMGLAAFLPRFSLANSRIDVVVQLPGATATTDPCRSPSGLVATANYVDPSPYTPEASAKDEDIVTREEADVIKDEGTHLAGSVNAAGGTQNNPVDLVQSTPGENVVTPSGSPGLVSRKRAPDLNDTLKSLIEMKNSRKRQRDTDIQDQTTKRLRLTHEHEIALKRMELNAQAAERAHERWMKELDLGMHRPGEQLEMEAEGHMTSDGNLSHPLSPLAPRSVLSTTVATSHGSGGSIEMVRILRRGLMSASANDDGAGHQRGAKSSRSLWRRGACDTAPAL